MIPLAIFLLGCAAIYVGTVRAAFTALMQLSLRLLAERNGTTDRLSAYLEEPVRLFVPTRLLLSAIAIAVVALLTRVIDVQTPRGLGGLVGALIGFVLLCEHLLPHLIVQRSPQAVLTALLPSFSGLAVVLSPLTRLVLTLGGRVQRESGPPGEDQGEGDHGEPPSPSEGMSGGDERRLLQSIVDFGGRLVREVMTPRPDILAVSAETKLEALRTVFREEGYSRIPVYRGNLDNILGFVYVKDLVHLDPAVGDAVLPTHLIRPAYFVPETKRVPELLKEFQIKHVQSAIVVDEYGGTAGLVTVEDLLEEIVGEIRDEYDDEAEPIVDEGDGVFVFSGRVHIDDMSERLGVAVEDEGFETVGGFLLTHVGRVPAVGESFEIDGLHVEVLEAERRRINKVRMRKVRALTEG